MWYGESVLKKVISGNMGELGPEYSAYSRRVRSWGLGDKTAKNLWKMPECHSYVFNIMKTYRLFLMNSGRGIADAIAASAVSNTRETFLP